MGLSEQWESIPCYDGYEISTLGRIRPFKGRTPRILKTRKNPDGYEMVNLSSGGKQTTFGVHLLLALAHLGPRPKGYEVCHNDGQRDRNVLSNLRYGTKSDNQKDMVIHGTCASANKTQCPAGHEYTESNTYRHGNKRWCRKCRQK